LILNALNPAARQHLQGQLRLGLVEVDAARVGEDALAHRAEQRHERLVHLFGGQVPKRDVERRECGGSDPAAAHVMQVMPAFVPEAARRRLLSGHERRDVVLQHRLERPAAHSAGVGEAGADQPPIGGHVGDHDLDVGHVLDRVAPSAAPQRQARKLGLDRLNSQFASPCVTY